MRETTQPTIFLYYNHPTHLLHNERNSKVTCNYLFVYFALQMHIYVVYVKNDLINFI
ncbi:hypothetical protein FH063_005899 [Azospirillum argentinense]|uniref:Uncharacterized protein n=1 Tax=Azospirillum argentinense TaxID=2970906 RepID=A0A5B0KRN2_9PROT|nr:hypothetical protein FH063_005899 [Azospirillum argentinense]